MAEYLASVAAQVTAGVLVFIITRWLNQLKRRR